MKRQHSLHQWIETLPEEGKYVFTRTRARAATSASDAAVKMTLYRLKKSGTIVNPRRGFYVVVPREYRSAGSPPASWFIDEMMRHLGRRYYVALLSAAALHGSAHQQPMAFQVMTDSAERSIDVGRVRIDFHASRCIDAAETQWMQTETGRMRVATPETTSFDLVRFPAASGYWSNVATVLAELAEKIRPAKLIASASRGSRSDVQRLGWLLDFVKQHALADALRQSLASKRLLPTPLTPSRTTRLAELDMRWRVIVNDDVEPDL